MVSLCICYWSLDLFCRLTRLSLPVSSVGLRFSQCVLKLWQTNNKTEELLLNLEKYSNIQGPSARRQIDQENFYSEFKFCCIIKWWLKNDNELHSKTEMYLSLNENSETIPGLVMIPTFSSWYKILLKSCIKFKSCILYRPVLTWTVVFFIN